MLLLNLDLIFLIRDRGYVFMVWGFFPNSLKLESFFRQSESIYFL